MPPGGELPPLHLHKVAGVCCGGRYGAKVGAAFALNCGSANAAVAGVQISGRPAPATATTAVATANASLVNLFLEAGDFEFEFMLLTFDVLTCEQRAFGDTF